MFKYEGGTGQRGYSPVNAMIEIARINEANQGKLPARFDVAARGPFIDSLARYFFFLPTRLARDSITVGAIGPRCGACRRQGFRKAFAELRAHLTAM